MGKCLAIGVVNKLGGTFYILLSFHFSEEKNRWPTVVETYCHAQVKERETDCSPIRNDAVRNGSDKT